MHTIFMTNVLSDVIKANRRLGVAFFKLSKRTADTDFAHPASFSLNAEVNTVQMQRSRCGTVSV